MATNISIRGVGPPEGKLCIIKVRGVLDAESADDLEKALTTIVGKGLWRVIVDLSGVNYISSAGWGIFTGQIKEVRSRGGDIKLAAMQPGVREVFELLELDYFIQSFDTVEEAQKRFLRRLGIPMPQARESVIQVEPKKEEVIPPLSSRKVPPLPESAAPQIKEIPKPLEEKPQLEKKEPTIEEKVEEILRDNPGYGVWKVKKALKSPEYGHTKVRLRHLHLIVKSLRQELSEEAISPPSRKEPTPILRKPSEDEREKSMEWAKLKEEREKLEEEKRLMLKEREKLREEWEKVRAERIGLIKARRESGSGGSRRIPIYFNEIVKIVRQHPQFGPKLIQRELNTSAYGFISLSCSTIYRRLRRGGLNTKEKRLRFASLGAEQ